MKKIYLSIVIVIALIYYVDAQKANKTTLVSMQDGEQLVYGENCFNLNLGGKDAVIFTSKSTGGKVQFFMYENGVKKGPYDEVKQELIKCNGSTYSKNCARFANSSDIGEVMEKYVVINQADGTASIKLDGKTYGPYIAVSHLFVTGDNKKFYAVVVNVSTMKTEFICSDGRMAVVNGGADGIYVSPDGNEAYLFQRGLINVEEIVRNGGDISKLNMGDFEKVLLLNINGKQFGPFDKLSSSEVWFCKTNNSLIYRVGNDVYLNGMKSLTLQDTPDPCTFWLSNDSKKNAVVNYDKIVFSDGESYPYPLEVETVISNGKTYLIWASLENGTNLVLYKKEF